MTRMNHDNPYRTGKPYLSNGAASGAREDWYPLTNVEWIPHTEQVCITVGKRRERVRASGWVERLKQMLSLAEPEYREQEINRCVEKVTYEKKYLR